MRKASLLKSLTNSEYTLKDSFAFTREIVKQDSEFFMRSPDVDFLFTNITLEEDIDICSNTGFKTTERVESLSKIRFKELFLFATKVSYFIFNRKLYKQADGVVMGSPAGPHQLMLFMLTLRRIGYKIVYWYTGYAEVGLN